MLALKMKQSSQYKKKYEKSVKPCNTVFHYVAIEDLVKFLFSIFSRYDLSSTISLQNNTE